MLCRSCFYNLEGLTKPDRAVTCPECGRAELPWIPPPPHEVPTWPAMLWKLCGPTFTFCNVCLFFLFMSPLMSLVVAVPAFLSGPIVPLFGGPSLAHRIQRGSKREIPTSLALIAAGWTLNAIIAAGYLFAAVLFTRHVRVRV